MKRSPAWDDVLRDVRRVTAAGRRLECRAYQLWDGFDNYSNSTELWTSVTGSGTPSYSSSYARFPAPAGLVGQGIRFPGGLSQRKTWNMNSNQPTMIFGFAVLFESLPSSGFNGFLQFRDNGTAQCTLAVSSTGAIALMQGASLSVVLASSAPGVITANVWTWLDVKVTINNGSGSIAVYLNQQAGGIALFNTSGLATEQSGNNYMNQFSIGDIYNGTVAAYRFDDFHSHDTSGSAPNSIIGDSRIYTKDPNAAGFQTQWTPNGASANWQCVDDVPPDGDTTYVSSSTAGQIDGYAAPAAGFTGTPNGLVRRSYIRKDDASTHTFQNGVRSGSSNGLGTAVAVPSTYGWFDSFFANDPATSAAWTAASADAAQLIIDETS